MYIYGDFISDLRGLGYKSGFNHRVGSTFHLSYEYQGSEPITIRYYMPLDEKGALQYQNIGNICIYFGSKAKFETVVFSECIEFLCSRKYGSLSGIRDFKMKKLLK